MKICIHRGSKQIGGTCVELQNWDDRILLDIGLPLDAEYNTPILLPKINYKNIKCILISHPHQDHYGLLKHLPKAPIAIGPDAKNIINAASPFVPNATTLGNTIDLEDRKSFRIASFEITPFLADHSAFNAFSILIEAGGRKVFYSGDLRAHGRKWKLFEKLIRLHPENIDVLLLEGSSLGRLDPNKRFKSEDDLENEMKEEFDKANKAKGLVMVNVSSQNIDRIVTIYRACKKAKRIMLLDMYAADILNSVSNTSIPNQTLPFTKIYIPRPQAVQISKMQNQEVFDRLRDVYNKYRIYEEGLDKIAHKAVLLFRQSMIGDYAIERNLSNALMIHSLWSGYLTESKDKSEYKNKKIREFKNWLKRNNIPLKHIHTSGHASIPDLKRLVAALDPGEVVPIHTFEPKMYEELFPNVKRHGDGECWEI